MNTRAQMQFLFHGAVILLGGMLTGFPLAMAIAGERGAQEVHAWAVTHTSLVSTGILLIAIGAAARHLALAERESRLLSWTSLASAYALCIGLIVTAISGNRGLAPEGSALNLALFVANLTAVLGLLAAGVLLVRGAYAALRAARLGTGEAGLAAAGLTSPVSRA
jgi:hypothetical protein